MKLNKLIGGYVFINGLLKPTGDMMHIAQKIRNMKMLAGSTETGAGEFYFDPVEKMYWHYIQHEDYSTVLQPIKRQEIENNYPSVNCDHLLKVIEDSYDTTE
jgi:hypothetical protein